MEMPVAMARLQLVPGIGPWARRRGLPTHPWGPDALTLGDLHLPVQIGYALTGARRGTGVQTLQLLQPYAGQRYRAARLILINAGPDAWYRGDPRKLGVETHEEWWAATRNPDVVRAMLEDYRAGLTNDREHEEADYAGGTRIHCPVRVLWSRRTTCTAIRVTPGSTGPTTCRAMASTRATTWPRRPPARSPLPQATFSPSDCLGTPTTQNASPEPQHVFSWAAHGWRRDALSRGTISSMNGPWPPCSTSQESTPTCGSTSP
ncbi:hypothetical protein GCM10010284_34890 [Streptomyces rubiginosohelvolus]|nr:hypothetical protein GCM10010284_34890 [Streptomyces rubiginosohelvolus]